MLTSECAVNCQRKCSNFEYEIGYARYQANMLNTICMRLQPGTCKHHHVASRCCQSNNGMVQFCGSTGPRAATALIKREGIAGLYGGVRIMTWAAG